MTGLRRGYADGPCGQIHYRFASARKPAARTLYALHQSPKSGLSFEPFLVAASDDRDVVAPDYPGYGMSDRPAAEADATIELYAAACWHVADALGHRDAIDLIGHHTGGLVAVEMARQRPDRVAGIVIISALILTDEERASFREYFTPVPLDDAGTRFKVMWERINIHAGPGMTLRMKASSMLENLMGGDAYEWGHMAAFANSARFEGQLRSLPHRITIINVDDELQAATRRAGGLVRNGALVERPDWGHGLFQASTAEVASFVKAALQP
ncbi:MAG: alpha/beta fold hydrolase [Alphaproteobacteria bacterium]|nr:alpha/beta fold hydrolase [Alphaproteobacteria bacterium]